MNRRNFILALAPQAITVPKASYPRAKIEADLIEALRQDIDCLHRSEVNWVLRKQINHLVAELSKEY
jgi:hypothetical protein